MAAVVDLDQVSDLEEDPAWLAEFAAVMDREGADVVYGVQTARKGGFVERAAGAIFYSTFNLLLEHPLPRNVVTTRLMTRRYVSQLVRHRDREVCLAALWVITGFRQVGIPVVKGTRGTPATYGVAERAAVMVNAITSFSSLYWTAYGKLMAGTAIASVPILIAFLFTQRFFIRGMSLTGLKDE